MRKILIVMTVLFALSMPALAETIHVGVNGLVCAFCAKGIENSFGKYDVVESIKVDLDEKLVTITTAAPQSLSDEVIRQTITDAGYMVTGIHRQP